MKIYLELFLTFAKLGACTFGGGYAMLPFIQKEVVEKRHWATEQEIMDYYAVGQCTPGIIAVNTATFIGYNKKGILGGICATLGIVFPSIIIILLIANFLEAFASNPMIQHALAGIRIAVCVLILNAVIKLFKSGVKDNYGYLLFLSALIISCFKIIPTIGIILISAAIGILIHQTIKKKEESES